MALSHTPDNDKQASQSHHGTMQGRGGEGQGRCSIGALTKVYLNCSFSTLNASLVMALRTQGREQRYSKLKTAE